MPVRHTAAMAALVLSLCVAVPASAVSRDASAPTPQLVLGPPSGDPLELATNYTNALTVFEADPGSWGGAYADGDYLVVKVVDQSLDEARDRLGAAGVGGAVRLVTAVYSLASLEQQAARVESVVRGGKHPAVRTWGPDYRSSSVRVGVSGDDGSLRGDLDAAIDPSGPPVELYAEPGVPASG